jgi:hypothetical protein
MTTPTRGKMSAITTISNPLSASHDKIMIFSSSKNYTLSLENRTIGGEFAHTMGTEGETTQGPQLAFPSQLTSMIYKDAVCVYGITGLKKEDLEVALLSPVYMPEKNVKPTFGSLAGCTTADGTGYLYMLSDNEQGKTLIHEWKLSSADEEKPSIPVFNFYEKTSLFALYDKVQKLKWLIYQQSDNTISVWNFKRKADNVVSESKGRAKPGTPITACIVPVDSTTSRPARLYIYFVNSDNELQSANCIMTDTLYFTTTDEKPSTVGEGQTMSSISSLSVFLDPTNSRNIVYGIKTGSSKISPTYDTWRTK